MKIRAQLLIDVVAEFEDDAENTAETVRYCVEQDLEDNGFQVDDCRVVEGTEKIFYDKEQ